METSILWAKDSAFFFFLTFTPAHEVELCSLSGEKRNSLFYNTADALLQQGNLSEVDTSIKADI